MAQYRSMKMLTKKILFSAIKHNCGSSWVKIPVKTENAGKWKISDQIIDREFYTIFWKRTWIIGKKKQFSYKFYIYRKKWSMTLSFKYTDMVAV